MIAWFHARQVTFHACQVTVRRMPLVITSRLHTDSRPTWERVVDVCAVVAPQWRLSTAAIGVTTTRMPTRADGRSNLRYMSRRCERPGCRELAAVAYGFDSEQSVVWLESVAATRVEEVRSGMVCRRHGDSMSAPRGWTLDDRRGDAATLFGSLPDAAVVAVAAPRRTQRARRTPRPVDLTGELQFGPIDDPPVPESGPEVVDRAVVSTASATATATATVAGSVAEYLDPDETKAIAWSPHFDQTDDLGGLLRAESPLLARAFGRRPLGVKRTDGRPGDRTE